MNQEIQSVLEVDSINAGIAGRAETEVAALPKRRRFVAAYKRRMVREADACTAPGAVGALLRREGLYSSHLTHWRQELAALEHAALAAKPRGPQPDMAKAEARRTAVLEREVARLRGQLERAEQSIAAQKKWCELLGLPTAAAGSR